MPLLEFIHKTKDKEPTQSFFLLSVPQLILCQSKTVTRKKSCRFSTRNDAKQESELGTFKQTLSGMDARFTTLLQWSVPA